MRDGIHGGDGATRAVDGVGALARHGRTVALNTNLNLGGYEAPSRFD